jgi:hypothetical protein
MKELVKIDNFFIDFFGVFFDNYSFLNILITNW